jgi:cell wall-associated NlpC family hydrolase
VNPARALTAPFRLSHAATVRFVVVAAAAVLVVGLVPTGKAHADPSLKEAEKNVAALTKQMEVTTEQYNDAREDLKASQAKVAALEPQAKKLSTQLGGYETKVSEFAGDAYYGGRVSAFSALLESGSPQTFFDQVAFLQYLSGTQRSELDVLVATKKKFDVTKNKVDAEHAKQAAHEKTLREKRAAITKDLAKWQKLSAQLGGGSGNNIIASTYDGPASGRAGEAVRFAYAQQGKQYEFGAAGPSTYDCSGLTMRAWGAAGVSMAHSARRQMAAFPRVSLSALLPGDLVFYGSPPHHVAIYVGNGQVMHAPQTGQVVQLASVRGAGGSSPSGAVRPS